jgi:hypothetical protein
MSIRSRHPDFNEEVSRREARKPREVDLLGITAFLKETVEPAVVNFERQVSSFFGSQREGRPTDPTTLRYEKILREKWVQRMAPLSFFTKLLLQDRRALMVISGWTSNLRSVEGEAGNEIIGTEVYLITPKNQGKFKAFVMKDEVAKRRLTPEEKRPLFVLRIQVMKGIGLSISHKTGDPSLSKMEEDEAETKRIRIYTQRIISDPSMEEGYRVENLLGIDIKSSSTHDQEKPRYTLLYIFQSDDISDLLIRNPETMGVSIRRDSFDKAVECLERVAGGQNG